MCNRALLAIVFLGGALAAGAQSLSRKIELPPDSPITVVSADWGDSNATPRGGAYLVDVHAAQLESAADSSGDPGGAGPGSYAGRKGISVGA